MGVSVGCKVGVLVVVGLEVTVTAGDAVSVGCNVGVEVTGEQADNNNKPVIARMEFFIRLSYIVRPDFANGSLSTGLSLFCTV